MHLYKKILLLLALVPSNLLFCAPQRQLSVWEEDKVTEILKGADSLDVELVACAAPRQLDLIKIAYRRIKTSQPDLALFLKNCYRALIKLRAHEKQLENIRLVTACAGMIVMALGGLTLGLAIGRNYIDKCTNCEGIKALLKYANFFVVDGYVSTSVIQYY